MSFRRDHLRIAANLAIDGFLAALAVIGAFWLADPRHPVPSPPVMAMAGAAAVWLVETPLGLPRRRWRRAAPRTTVAMAASAVCAALLVVILLVATGFDLPSDSFPPLLAITLGFALIVPGAVYRLVWPPREREGDRIATALLLGTGETVGHALTDLAAARGRRHHVTGVLYGSGTGSVRTDAIHGVPVLGSVAELGTVLDRLEAEGRLPERLIVAGNDLVGGMLRDILAEAEARGLHVGRAPRPSTLPPSASGAATLGPIAIEDLLPRPQVALDREGMARMIQGRRVLVTGAGGSIGAELVRQIAGFGPERLVLVETSEYALWQIDRQLSEIAADLERTAIIADVRDRARIAALFAELRPELVFHAAALKHVPIVEANPLEGLATNVLGSRNVADAARAAGAALMVLISTDKAVNPSSVMGASKRLAEMYAQGLDVAARRAGGTAGAAGAMRIVTVRFGNVLGSTGSVVEVFRRQLERGGPLTVTHPDMWRFFMTLREAVSLVLQATVVGQSDAALPVEEGGIFVLDMGEPVKIVDLARQIIRLTGLRPDIDIAIRFTGLRPGEKLLEEVFHGAETPIETRFPGLLMAAPRVADAALVGRAIDELAALIERGDSAGALAALARLVPEFGTKPLAAGLPSG